MDAKPYRPAVRELAARIYTELIVATTGQGTDAAACARAQEVARLSFQLAESFQAVEDELNSANLPKNVGFKLEATDIAEWSRK
jgi:hypothetical protein